MISNTAVFHFKTGRKKTVRSRIIITMIIKNVLVVDDHDNNKR